MSSDRRKPALTESEYEEGIFTCNPEKKYDLESATEEADGSILLWNGANNPTRVPLSERDRLLALTLRGKLKEEHQWALAESARKDSDDSEERRRWMRDMYALALRVGPPEGFEDAAAQLELLVAKDDFVGGQREQRMERFAEGTPSAILYTIDCEFSITSATGPGLAFLPAKTFHAVRDNCSLFEFVNTTDERHPVVEAHRAALRGESVRYDLALGSRKWSGQLEPLRTGDGRIIGVVGYTYTASAGLDIGPATIPMTVGLLTTGANATILDYNVGFTKLWGLKGDLLHNDIHVFRDMALGLVIDPEHFIQEVASLIVSNEEGFSLIELRTGRILHCHSHPVRDYYGRIVGRTWVFQDATNDVARELEPGIDRDRTAISDPPARLA